MALPYPLLYMAFFTFFVVSTEKNAKLKQYFIFIWTQEVQHFSLFHFKPVDIIVISQIEQFI